MVLVFPLPVFTFENSFYRGNQPSLPPRTPSKVDVDIGSLDDSHVGPITSEDVLTDMFKCLYPFKILIKFHL